MEQLAVYPIEALKFKKGLRKRRKPEGRWNKN